jgi:hypothetical protein
MQGIWAIFVKDPAFIFNPVKLQAELRLPNTGEAVEA